MPALTRSLWVGFPTLSWHCLAVARGCLPPPSSPWLRGGLVLVFFFWKACRKDPKDLSPPLRMLHVTHQYAEIRSEKTYFDFTPMQNHEEFACLLLWRAISRLLPGSLFLCPAQGGGACVWIYIYIKKIYHQTQMSIVASSRAASRSIQPPTAGLEQFVHMKHYSFPLLQQVKNKTLSRDMIWRTNTSSFLESFTTVQILKLSIRPNSNRALGTKSLPSISSFKSALWSNYHSFKWAVTEFAWFFFFCLLLWHSFLELTFKGYRLQVMLAKSSYTTHNRREGVGGSGVITSASFEIKPST